MLNYRVQTCIDSATYNLLENYMKKHGYEKASMAVRKILREYFGIDVDDDNCKTVKL